MHVIPQELGCFFDSALQRRCRDMRKPFIVEFLNGKTIRKHIDHLRYRYTCAFNRQLTTYPLFPCFKVFHSIRILPSRPDKVNANQAVIAISAPSHPEGASSRTAPRLKNLPLRKRAMIRTSFATVHLGYTRMALT